MKKLLTVIGAAAAGFAAGVLTAPKSGRETRADLKQKANDFKDIASEKAEMAKSAAKDGYGAFKSGAQKVSDSVSQAAREVKGSVEKPNNKQ